MQHTALPNPPPRFVTNWHPGSTTILKAWQPCLSMPLSLHVIAELPRAAPRKEASQPISIPAVIPRCVGSSWATATRSNLGKGPFDRDLQWTCLVGPWGVERPKYLERTKPGLQSLQSLQSRHAHRPRACSKYGTVVRNGLSAQRTTRSPKCPQLEPIRQGKTSLWQLALGPVLSKLCVCVPIVVGHSTSLVSTCSCFNESPSISLSTTQLITFGDPDAPLFHAMRICLASAYVGRAASRTESCRTAPRRRWATS